MKYWMLECYNNDLNTYEEVYVANETKRKAINYMKKNWPELSYEEGHEIPAEEYFKNFFE